MKTINVKKAETIKNPHGVRVSKLYDTAHAQVMHITLEPGESLKKHMTPVDVFFYVLEGTGVVEIGQEKQEVEADTLIDSPAKIPHCWYNQSDKPVRILVAKLGTASGKD
jgi:quercetin dioxygenase-like cupin family protein